MGRLGLVWKGLLTLVAIAATAPFALASLHPWTPSPDYPRLTTRHEHKPLFDLTRMRPGVAVSRCITITGGGGHAAGVALYATGKRSLLDHYLTLTVLRGGTEATSCPALGARRTQILFRGALAAYPRTLQRAVVDKRRLPAGGKRAYRFTIELANNSRAEGLGSVLSFLVDSTSRRARFVAERVFPPVNTAPPFVAGSVRAGQRLTTNAGAWSQHPTSHRYQWQRCMPGGTPSCASINGATAASYTIAAADAGYLLRVEVVAHNAGGESNMTVSRRTTEVPAVAQTMPSISGLAAVGQTLTAVPGSWNGKNITYSYQWRRCNMQGSGCRDIPGATRSTYRSSVVDLLATLTLTVTATEGSRVSASASTLASNPIAAAVNPIVIENAKPGTSAWQISGPPSSDISGYASETSVLPGDTLHLHISSIGNARYRVEIYRLGWYAGARGRLITCVPSCSGDEPGMQYPVAAPDPATGYLDAGWPVTDTTTIGSDWTSGYYLAKLVLTSGSSEGGASYVPFIVRAPAGTASAILVQASVNTWEAYNDWGGKSLYTYNSSNGVAATQVSFNRPFVIPNDEGQSPLRWEYPVAAFLEREGYDVSYQTDTDTDQNPTSLLGHRLDVVNGHDEYWSPPMRTAWTAARDAGVNLAFLGGDIGYWQIRYASNDRALIEYRSASADPDPVAADKTSSFQALGEPECELLGIQYKSGQSEVTATGDAAYDYTANVDPAMNAWFAGTGLDQGAILTGAVGYEWDAIQPGCNVPPLQDLFHWQESADPLAADQADAVTYQAGSGAQVFSDGTLNLDYALDNYGQQGFSQSPSVQALFTNMLNSLSDP